jgi:hypothetical protein
VIGLSIEAAIAQTGRHIGGVGESHVAPAGKCGSLRNIVDNPLVEDGGAVFLREMQQCDFVDQ